MFLLFHALSCNGVIMWICVSSKFLRAQRWATKTAQFRVASNSGRYVCLFRFVFYITVNIFNQIGTLRWYLQKFYVGGQGFFSGVSASQGQL